MGGDSTAKAEWRAPSLDQCIDDFALVEITTDEKGVSGD